MLGFRRKPSDFSGNDNVPEEGVVVLLVQKKPGAATSKTQHTTAKMPESLKSVLTKCYDEYVNHTPKKLKMMDAYLAYIMLTGIMQFVYCCLVGTFPFNSFLSGFISCVGSFVLGGMVPY